MPTYLLIGIPIFVGILMYAILSLPDEEIKDFDLTNKKSSEPAKKKGKKK